MVRLVFEFGGMQVQAEYEHEADADRSARMLGRLIQKYGPRYVMEELVRNSGSAVRGKMPGWSGVGPVKP